jgi:hypothetical protein
MDIHYIRDTTDMANFFIDFQWHKDSKGYRLVSERRIVRNGGKLILYRPLDIFPRLFSQLANLKTPKEVLKFVEKFGLLWGFAQGDDVEDVLEVAEQFQRVLDDREKGGDHLNRWLGRKGGLGCTLTAFVKVDEVTGAFRLQLAPETLHGALWLQLARSLTGGAEIRPCLHCGDWFEAGIGTGRRLDAKFCCDEHRTIFNSMKRRKGG